MRRIYAFFTCALFALQATGQCPITPLPPTVHSPIQAICICAQPGATIAPGNLGPANVITNCSSCESALPLELVTFYGSVLNNTATLEWETSMEKQARSFTVERSYNGRQYEPAGEAK